MADEGCLAFWHSSFSGFVTNRFVLSLWMYCCSTYTFPLMIGLMVAWKSLPAEFSFHDRFSASQVLYMTLLSYPVAVLLRSAAAMI